MDTEDDSGRLTIDHLTIGTYKKFTIKKKFDEVTDTNKKTIDDSITKKMEVLLSKNFHSWRRLFKNLPAYWMIIL